MKVSVIVPIYNSESTIERCVDSIRKQTYSNIEIILINDGSMDKSLQICQNLAKLDSRIVVIDKCNGGVSSARNAGLEVASGEAVCFVDSDDVIMPRFIEKLVGMLQKSQVDMAVCSSKKSLEEPTTEDDVIIYTAEEMLELLLESKISFGVWCILVKKDVITQNDLRFFEGYRYSEDLHMVWRLVHYCRKIAFTEEKNYVYFDITGSAMSKFDERRLDSLELFADLEEFFKLNRPEISQRFSKYAVSKNCWSLFWQAAVKLPKKEFLQLCKNNSARKYFSRLLTYRSIKVSMSSFVGMMSLNAFRVLARTFGKKYCH